MNKLFIKPEKKTFPAAMSSVKEILEYAGHYYERAEINPHLSDEYQLAIEEVLLKLLEKAKPESEVSIESYQMAGSLVLKLSCPGKPVLLYQENEEDLGGRLIEEYQDYLKQSYASGVNDITFTINLTYGKFRMNNLLILILASVIAMILRHVCSSEQITYLTESLILPADRFFLGCLEAISAPLVFFSLAALIIRLRYKFEREKHMVGLFIRYLLTSLIAVVIGFLLVQLFSMFIGDFSLDGGRGEADAVMGDSLKSFIEQFTFTNIIAPFESDNPIPMLILAVLVGIAASSLFGKDGGMIRRAIRGLSSLFARMMVLVHSTIPLFVFLAVLWGWFDRGSGILSELAMAAVVFLPAVLLMFVVYAIQLGTGGLRLQDFWREYKEILAENLMIGSSIDALPYNKRVMCRKSTMPVHFMKEGLTLGSLVNMDGNCLAISVVTFLCIFGCRYSLTTGEIISLMLVILLISIGAPNQPGSFLLSIAFIMQYVGIASEMYEEMIIFEAIFGILYSFVNASGDIVTMAIESEQWKKK